MYYTEAGNESPGCCFLKGPPLFILSIFDVYIDCQPTSNSVICTATK